MRADTVHLPNLGTSAAIKEPLMVIQPKQSSLKSDPGEQAVNHFVHKLKAS